MKVRFILKPHVTGDARTFSVVGLGEVIMHFDEGGADSVFVEDLQVQLASGEWKLMTKAFADKDIIPDNYNVWFGVPKTPEDQERGYFL